MGSLWTSQVAFVFYRCMWEHGLDGLVGSAFVLRSSLYKRAVAILQL
jgi:hypothetical protein